MTRFLDSRYAQLGAYLLIVVVGIVGFTQITHVGAQRTKDRKAQTLALCQESVISRDAVRDNIVSFNKFLISTVPPAKLHDPQTEAGIEKLKKYEVTQLKKYPKLACDRSGSIVKAK